MTPCEELGYKVGDEFIIQEDSCGFVKGQTVKLYQDDGSNCPLFQGINSRYNLCDGQEGTYFNLDCVVKLVKEEKEEMQFDMSKEPWFIRYSNKEEFKLVDEWVKENYGDSLGVFYQNTMAMTNIDQSGIIRGNVMWLNEEHIKSGPERHEIKLTFKTVIDSVTFPEVKTEQQKQIEELEKTILLAQQQIEELKKI